MLYDAKRWDKPVVDEVGAVLLEAAEIIKFRGWCQFNFESSAGSVCAVGAIEIAADGELHLVAEACTRLAAFINHQNVPQWNDGKHQSMANVVASIRAAANSSHEGCGG